MNDEIVRECVQLLKRRFIAWRIPPVELPPESLIEEVVREILKRGVKYEQEYRTIR